MLFRRVKVITILLMVFMMSIGCSRRKEVSIEPKKETKTTAEKSSSKETIYVYVCGEVKHPGVYRFSKGERIVSAVKAAGGLTKKASAESINQAEKMKDGQQITIPSKKQTAKNEGSDSKAVQSSSGKINICLLYTSLAKKKDFASIFQKKAVTTSMKIQTQMNLSKNW